MRVDTVISSVGLELRGAVHPATGSRAGSAVDDRGNMKGPTGSDEVILSETGQSLTDLDKVMKSLKEYSGLGNFSIRFATDDQTGSLVVSVVDRETGEVLRQIPPDEILSLRSHLQTVLESGSNRSA
jgi:flagellar protein FlaG